MKKAVSIISAVILIGLPMVALAVTIPPPPGEIPCKMADPIACLLTRILDFIWPIFFGVAVIMLLVSAFLFLLAQGEADKIKAARWSLCWAVSGIIVGVRAFSIPNVIVNFFR